MNERRRGSITDARWIDLNQGCDYTGLGKATFRKWAEEQGAVIKIGRSVRYDKVIIDAAMDKATKRA